MFGDVGGGEEVWLLNEQFVNERGGVDGGRGQGCHVCVVGKGTAIWRVTM